MKGIVSDKALRANNMIILNFSASNTKISKGIIITINQTDFSFVNVMLNVLIPFNNRPFMVFIFFFYFFLGQRSISLKDSCPVILYDQI